MTVTGLSLRSLPRRQLLLAAMGEAFGLGLKALSRAQLGSFRRRPAAAACKISAAARPHANA